MGFGGGRVDGQPGEKHEPRYQHKTLSVARRKCARVTEDWLERGWELESLQDGRFRSTITLRRRRTPRFRVLARTGLALSLVAGVYFGSTDLPFIKDPLDRIQANAEVAVQALESGDLVGLDAELTAHRGQPDFAYFFAAHSTPRALGDALATVAGPEGGTPLASAIDPDAYAVTLANLAGTLGLATFGTGDRALPAKWTTDFISATTTPEELYGADAGADRVNQDAANKQNLLLLLSRGYWSTDFLKSVTAAYWTYDHEKGSRVKSGGVVYDG